MDYLDLYKSRVLKGAESTKDRMEKDIEISFEKYLQQSPTCKEVPISKVGEFPNLNTMSKELVSINDLTQNDKRALDEKKLLVRKNCNIDIGCYVRFDNVWWLIIFKEHKILDTYKKFIMKRCNQIFNYKYKGITYNLPVSIENLTLRIWRSIQKCMLKNQAKSV